MKKYLTIFSVLVLVLLLLVSCKGKNGNQDEKPNDDNSEITVNIGGLKGPTTMGMVKMLDDSENKKIKNNYNYTMAAAADELTPKFIKGELDIISVPANLASILYNNTKGKAKVIAINTLGVVYIVEKGGNEINSFADLNGKTIYATGKGTIPEYALNYLSEKNNLSPENDFTVMWKSEPSEIASIMAKEEHVIAMIPQPFVTSVMSKFDDLHIAIDLTKEWEEKDKESEFITSVIVVNSDFVEKNGKAVDNFLSDYSSSLEFVNENVQDAAALVEKYGIINADVAEKAIPYCNLVFIFFVKMKTSLKGYLEILYKFNQKAVGGVLPGDDFYLIYE